MLFDVASAAATDSYGFSLFGMSTSDSINAIIAVVAVLGFISSIAISILTLKRTKNISLFERRVKFIEYILSTYKNRDVFFSDNNNKTELTNIGFTVSALFNNKISTQYNKLEKVADIIFDKKSQGISCLLDETDYLMHVVDIIFSVKPFLGSM